MLQCLAGEDALAALRCEDFAAKWRNLFAACPWATAFQGMDFSRTWYECYDDQYRPLIYYVAKDQSSLSHLICLAQSKTDRQVVPCGAQQSEYQCWLSETNDFAGFITAVVEHLAANSSARQLRFSYIPSALRPELHRLQPNLALHCHAEQRPLVRFAVEPAPWESLRKKSNRSKLSRLRREGDVRIELLDGSASEERLSQALQQVAIDYDFRQGAVNDTSPFMEDPAKFGFHVRLLQACPQFELLCLMVDETPVAAIFGAHSGDEFAVCVFSHSSRLAKHSPGKFVIAMGAQFLQERAVSTLDLTPGGNWKERFANAYDEVADVTLYFTRSDYLRKTAAERIAATVKQTLSLLGTDHQKLAGHLSQVRKATPRRIISKLRSLTASRKSREYRVYQYPLGESPGVPADAAMQRNSIEDLLTFSPSEPWQTRQGFLADSLGRLERGEYCYTKSENGRLAHFGWLIPRQSQSYFSEVGQAYEYPSPGCVLYDFYTSPHDRGRGHYRHALTQMLEDARSLDNVDTVYISVLAENAPSRHVIEKLGFRYLDSVYG